MCDDTCANLDNDPDHCGACGNACSTGQLCSQGLCVDDCRSSELECDMTCVDPLSDDNNCGECGNVCDSDRECRNGSCELRCETFLDNPIQDSTGAYWDALPTSGKTYAEAKVECESFGGRLPTATEAYRVSVAHTSDVGDAIDNDELWTLTPFNPTNQVWVNLSNGQVSSASTSATNIEFRCMCPEDKPTSFRGSSCYGESPGEECISIDRDGGRYNIDSKDRPPMRKSSAVWECAFEGGHIASYSEYAHAIKAGASGTNNWLTVADDLHQSNTALIRWTDAGWMARGNVSYTGTTTTAYGFRCAGSGYAGGLYTDTSAVSAGFSGSTLTGDRSDTAPSDVNSALQACFNKGGHLPTVSELQELIQQGLPAGTNEWLWTSTETGHNGVGFTANVVRWLAVNNRIDYSYSGNMDWVYRDARIGGYADRASRCVYYPIDTRYTGPSAADCQGGCTQISIPGGGVMWFDSEDRPAGWPEDAFDTCRQAGGRLATYRDMWEGIRAGLPNGSDVFMWTSDLTLGNQGSPLMRIVRWLDVDATWSGFYVTEDRSTWSWLEPIYSTPTRPYRCMWTNELR